MKRNSEGKKVLKESSEEEKDMFGNKKPSLGSWCFEDSDHLLVYTHNACENLEKAAAFDMDGTLITTKSGKVFPTDTTDWKLWSDKVVPKLKKLHEEGYKLVIFTNQKGIQTGQVDKKAFMRKIEAIVRRIGLPVQAFVSIGGGRYRKPCTGMWTALTENNGDVKVDVGKSFFVGDAAGRHKTKVHVKKDHSCADRYFAMNVGLRFLTPEQFFLDRKVDDPWGPPAFEPVNLVTAGHPLLVPEDSTMPWPSPEIIVMVGFPGSGKSTFAHSMEKKHGYAVVNRDTLGTWQKCVAHARNHLKEGRSVIVDNTNPDVESRSRYTALAKELSVNCRCFEMNCSLPQAMHHVRFRGLTRTDSQNVGTMVLRMFNSKFKKPLESEGFQSIVTVNFVPNFENEEHAALFSQYITES